MFARADGYYGTVFQGARGVTQGDPLSPTIFNVVVDTVVRQWVMVMLEGTEDQGKRGQEGRHQAALFYADDGMIALSDPASSKVYLIPWSAYLVVWDCGQTLVRYSAWSAALSRRWGISHRRQTGYG